MTTTRRLFFALLTAVVFTLTSATIGAKAPAPNFDQAPTAPAVVIPSWDDVSDAFPECVSLQEGTDSLDTIAVVADADTGKVLTITVAEAWDRALDKREGNDVWMLGLCDPTRTA